MLSSTCKYAIRAVVYLAVYRDENHPIDIKRIAADLHIPQQFLAKILQLLAKKGILHSYKGPGGGFTLTEKPESISLLSIVEIIDGKALFEDCLIGFKLCKANPGMKEVCTFHPHSHPVRRQIYELFANQTIGDLVEGLKGKPISEIPF